MTLKWEAREHIAREDQLLNLSGDALSVEWPEELLSLACSSFARLPKRRCWQATSSADGVPRGS